MSYNFLKNALVIKNSELCSYDTSNVYATNFSINGNVDGWDVYNDIYFYGCWKNVLFGSSYSRSPYIGRNTPFLPINGEDFYIVKIMLKLVNNNKDAAVSTLTKAKVAWTTLQDQVWDNKKEHTFDLIGNNQWNLYTLQLGIEKYWVGEINNLRIYPFIDGREKDQFAIKYIKITSLNKWSCANTSCDYYQQYTHNCIGAGTHGISEALISRNLYTTTENVDDLLIIDIDGYGAAKFLLGTNTNVPGKEMAKILSNKIASLAIGGYCYVNVIYTEEKTLKIVSGTSGNRSTVNVIFSAAAEHLGFFNGGMSSQNIVNGLKVASGFDYASTKLLTTVEINKLIDGDTHSTAYRHSPKNYSVEVGRQDYDKIVMNISSISSIYDGDNSLSNNGNTIIDWSHPVNNNGILKKIIVSGERNSNSKIKVCRPKVDNKLEVVYELGFPSQSALYSKQNVVHSVDCSILVNKGDVLAFYDFDLSVGTTLVGLPDATYSQVKGEANGIFDPGKSYSYGVGGFIFYGKSNKYQTNTFLDIDLGNRVNIEDISLYGKGETNTFEYNIASCLDVNWSIDLHNGTHHHTVSNYIATWTDTHQDIAYGMEALDDMSTVAENGIAGQIFGRDENGVWTSGKHSYFYVNGDAEWLHPEEYSYSLDASIYDFSQDKITFSLNFPQDAYIDIHKSIIYFKERNNFRSFALYYYLGKDVLSGNYVDSRHKLVPSFTLVKLDGISFDPSNTKVKAYLFKNPSSDLVEYGYGGVVKDFDRLKASTHIDWLVLEHDFEPVKCQGFNVETTHHNSTKVTEMEVYSFMTIDSSLVDKINLEYSSYQTIWKTASFASDPLLNKVSANIGGSPRYFRLELNAITPFYLNELGFYLGKQVINTTCSKDLKIIDAAINKDNSALLTKIYNMYNKPLDLKVDIPRNLASPNNTLFYNSLESEEGLTMSQIGPGCLVNYRKNFPIVNQHGQCAINTPAYVLKNIVENKMSYISRNGCDWSFYKTLSSGMSIDLTLEDYTNTYVTTINLPKYLGRYWKIQTSVSSPMSINDIEAFDSSKRVPISSIYLRENTGYSKLSSPIVSDGTNIAYQHISKEEASSSMIEYNSSSWEYSGTNDPIIDNNTLKYVRKGPTPEINYTTSNFKLVGDFDIEVFMDLSNLPFVAWMESGLRVVSDSDWYSMDQVTSSSTFYASTRHNGGDVTYRYSDSPTYRLRIVRIANKLTTYYHSGDVGSWISLVTNYPCTTKNMSIVLHVNFPTNYTINYSAFSKLTINQGILIYSSINNTSSLGFKTKEISSVDTIKIVHDSNFLDSVIVFNSMDNNTYYLLGASSSDYTLDTKINYIKLAIDLEKSHSLDIIRNYGDMPNKFIIPSVSTPSSSDSYISFFSADPRINLENTTDKKDARWVLLNLLSTHEAVNIDKLGIYPNIEDTYCIGGGYNCDWQPLGNILSGYSSPTNIALGTVVDGIYFDTLIPENAVNGSHINGMSNCWGFEKLDVYPYIDIYFGALYPITQINIYHGYSDNDSQFLNTEYTISTSTTISGNDFIEAFHTKDNYQLFRSYSLNSILAKRLRVTILAYNSSNINVGGKLFKGGFVREIEVYSGSESGHINSEEFPVVSMDLKDSFYITGHSLKTYNPTSLPSAPIDWDNSEEFFYYSDSIFETPQKTTFSKASQIHYVLESTISTGDIAANTPEYTLERGVYIPEGVYDVTWDCWNTSPSTTTEAIKFVGNDTNIIKSVTAESNGAITPQHVQMNITSEGVYTVIVLNQGGDASHLWGAKNVKIFRPSSIGKWIAVKRDTATGYAYDNNPNNFGMDTLDLIKVYGNTNYSPTAHWWWWGTTGIGTLSNDYITVKNTDRSLRIDYPASDEADYIEYLAGDDFGLDKSWSIKDCLSFWFYITDKDLLDLTAISVEFGLNSASGNYYYGWDLSKYILFSGWNKVNLKFEDYDFIFPYLDSYYNSSFLPKKFNLKTQNAANNHFKLNYKGLGYPFTIYITGINIERTNFDSCIEDKKGVFIYDTEYLLVPVSGLTLAIGTIEMWVKPYYDSKGTDIFGSTISRTIFSIVNSGNNIISLGIQAGSWFEFLFGQERSAVNVVSADEFISQRNAFNINTPFHMAVVWDSSGQHMSNSDTIRFYINDSLIYSSMEKWEVLDNQSTTIKLGGGNSPVAYNYDVPSGGGTFRDLKIYDYCKTDFSTYQDLDNNAKTYKAEEYMLISKDGLNFFGQGSKNLPLSFEQVPAEESVDLYVKTIKDNTFKCSNKTADLIITWLLSV